MWRGNWALVTPLEIQRLVAPMGPALQTEHGSSVLRGRARGPRRRGDGGRARTVAVSRSEASARAEPPAHHVATPDELERLAAEVGSAHRPIVQLAAVTELRFSECAGLRVRSLDLLHGLLTVTEGVVEAGGRDWTAKTLGCC